MNSRQKKSTSPLVYSTDPNYVAPGFHDEEPLEKIPINEQKIKVLISTKHRAGKMVTLVTNVMASEKEKEQMGKELKTFCGTGGSFKEGEIIIQGDQRDRALQWLHKNGFILARKL